MLADGLHDVPPGKVAAVVTHLEMRRPPALRPAPTDLAIRRVTNPDLDWYRSLFRRVGGYDWLWFSRLNLDDDALRTIITDPNVEIWPISKDGAEEGFLELDFRTRGTCELAFLALAPALIGTGTGRALMNYAITRAWARPISRFHVQTCTLDSPRALEFYRRSGFTPTRQQVEIADDPRLTGKLPLEAGPHVPLLRP
ncbi:GNAT family N-acetyltransferase [Pontibaca salina]|uniref:GNAT family N-acetyltransferase n=1 Tax=Pontibaca salina TaxID=2795731 RepID=A0A934LZR4_9RHOB|nr:GNAT family N-acetyltransferase [Pontibaca salina]MBI6629260.1 GNAT family N-acetyltransferase [Pontibaca salina]